MLLKTVATRVAKAHARSFCCQKCGLSVCLSLIKYEQRCIVHTVPKIHMNWTSVSIVGLGVRSV